MLKSYQLWYSKQKKLAGNSFRPTQVFDIFGNFIVSGDQLIDLEIHTGDLDDFYELNNW